MASIIVDNKKIVGGLITMSGNDANAYYCRETPETFSVNTAYNGSESVFDWIISKTTDSRYIKSGVTRITSKKKTLVINFDTAFPNSNYYVFFSPNRNINTYWCEKKANRFIMTGSSYLGEEISWLAIHKDFAVKTGIANPGTIYTGKRVISGSEERDNDLSMASLSDANRPKWTNCEYIIKPDNGADERFAESMNLNDYSVIVSANTNINTFWLEKSMDRVKIGTSFGKSCIIDYLIIKTGVDWWNEF